MELDDFDNEIATTIFLVEREIGCLIDENYPLMKYFSQVEEITKFYEKKSGKNNEIKFLR